MYNFADGSLTAVIRTQLEDYLRGRVPAQVEESLFQAGLELVRRESGGEVGELGPATPDLLLLYLFVLYRGSIKVVLCSSPSVPQPVVQSRRRPLLGPSPG